MFVRIIYRLRISADTAFHMIAQTHSHQTAH